MVGGLHYLEVEALYAARQEMAGSVTTSWTGGPGRYCATPRAAAAAARRVAELIGPELGWDEGRVEAEAEGYAEARRHELARAGLDVDPGRGRPANAGSSTGGAGEPG